MTIADSFLSKMTLAKQMFILGQLEGTKNTKVDRILAILNFDFCVVTLIVSACISSKENPKQKNGKKWRKDKATKRYIDEDFELC